jgi:hypothetical protein
MADLSTISPQLDEKESTCRAIIETPTGCRNKFDYDPDSGLFMLCGLLPEAYPVGWARPSRNCRPLGSVVK